MTSFYGKCRNIIQRGRGIIRYIAYSRRIRLFTWNASDEYLAYDGMTSLRNLQYGPEIISCLFNSTILRHQRIFLAEVCALYRVSF